MLPRFALLLLIWPTMAAADDAGWQETLELAESAYEQSPGDLGVRTALARARWRAGRLEEIEELLAGLDPKEAAPEVPALAWLTLGQLRAAEGRGQEAQLHLERAVARAPEDPEVLYWAGDLARRDRAIELLERYLVHREGEDPDRVEAAEGTIRVLRELGDRKLWEAASAPERLDAPLEQIWTTRGDVVGYALRVGLGERKKPVKLLLDTGSHGLFLTERQAGKRGFEPLAERVLHGGGGERRHKTVRGLFGSFRVGELSYTDALATVTPVDFDSTGRFHGLLGVSVFGGYRVTLDLDGRRLGLEATTEPLDGQPYWWVAGQLLVRACARGDDEEGTVCGLFVVDTGAMSSVLDRSFAARVPGARLSRPSAVQGFGGRVGEARVVEGVEIGFQQLNRRAGPVISYDLSVSSRLGGVEVSGLLGLDLLAGHRVVLDTVGQRIRVERPPRRR